jgi:hypothetical protein
MRKVSMFIHIVLLLVIVTLFAPIVVAKSSTPKIPTAPQAAMQKKAKGKKGVMRGTTQYDRWQAAIKHSGSRAAQYRAGNKGVK